MHEKTYRHIIKQPRLTIREVWVRVNAADPESVPVMLEASTKHLLHTLEDKSVPPAERRRAQHVHHIINDRSLYGITGVPRTPDAEI